MEDTTLEQFLLNQLSIPTRLLKKYTSLGLNEKEVMVILQIHRYLQTGIDFPTPDEISSYLTINEKECSYILRKLIQKGFLAINHLKNNQNQLSESYSLNPLWTKLYSGDHDTTYTEENHEGSIFILFEQEFGRPLSPFEIETINVWLDEDHIAPALIKAGLRESVLMGKLNFKYIDRILRDWKKKGIQTVEQAREESRTFRDHQSRQSSQLTETTEQKKERNSLLYYNWLESDD